jgi:hypothetical protein
MNRIRMRRLALLVLALATPMATYAQDPVPADTAAVPAPGPRAPARIDTTYEAPSARAALIKSLIIPGWGQFSVGSHVRGGIYLAIGATSWGMLGKTIHKLGEAQDQVRDRYDLVSDSLRTAMMTDPDLADQLADTTAFEAEVEADSLLSDKRGLVDARRQQRQDWIAYTLFFTFLNGLDAYVAAHLVDFPGELDVERRADGSVSVGVQLAAPRRRDE